MHQYAIQKERVQVQFGDLPVNLRQEILNLLRDRNIAPDEITITELEDPRRTP